MKSGIGNIHRGAGLFGPGMLENPYPVYQELRESDPVHWDNALHAWVLTRHEDVALGLNDARFSSRRVAYARHRFADSKWDPLFRTLNAKMSEQDEPDHKRLRALVHDAFIRTAVERWEPRIRERVRYLLDEGVRNGQLDFMADVAVPLPLLVILEIMGIPEEDRQQVKAWCDDFAIVALNYFAGITEEQLQQGLKSISAFREYLRERAELVRHSPKQDLLSSLVHAIYEGSELSLEELLANCLLLLSAGNETTTCVMGNGLAALLEFPDQLQLLREEPARLPHAVEEFLRYDSPVQFLGRIALEDISLHRATVRRGDLVLLVIASANRDPARFTEPDRLDITRQNLSHLSFGHGPHFCAGAQLARLEAILTFEAILARFPRFELQPDASLSHRANFNVRCFQELPLRVNG